MHRILPLLFATLLLHACGSTPPGATEPSRAELDSSDSTRVEERFDFERADASRVANLVRGFFDGGSPTITVVDGRAWDAEGTPAELRALRLVHRELDREDLPSDLVPRAFLFELQDARLLANAARAELADHPDWILLCPDPGHLYALVPRGDVGALEDLVARLRTDD